MIREWFWRRNSAKLRARLLRKWAFWKYLLNSDIPLSVICSWLEEICQEEIRLFLDLLKLRLMLCKWWRLASSWANFFIPLSEISSPLQIIQRLGFSQLFYPENLRLISSKRVSFEIQELRAIKPLSEKVPELEFLWEIELRHDLLFKHKTQFS